MSGVDLQTIETYTLYAAQYDEETTDFWREFPLAFPKIFVDSMPEAALVLSAGSGPGRDAELLRGLGLNVTCLDASSSMVSLTAQKGFESVEGDLLNLPFAEGSFDGIWSYTSLIHLPRHQVSQAIAEFSRLLAPGGVLALGVIEGEGERILAATETVLSPRLFTFFTREEMGVWLSEHFTVTHSESMQPNRMRYLHIIAQKK